MIIIDLDYIYYSAVTDQVSGAAYTNAKATASASAFGTLATADATAIGHSVSARTTTRASFQSGSVVNYSFALAGSVAIAQTGYSFSASVDYQVDAKVSKHR